MWHSLTGTNAKDVLHFESPNALKCANTHKMYQSLEVIVDGTILKIIRFYVSSSEDAPSVEVFLAWNPNSTYHVVQQLILNYGLAIMLMKAGDRRNYDNLHRAGRYNFMELFYGFNHPIYIPSDRV